MRQWLRRTLYGVARNPTPSDRQNFPHAAVIAMLLAAKVAGRSSRLIRRRGPSFQSNARVWYGQPIGTTKNLFGNSSDRELARYTSGGASIGASKGRRDCFGDEAPGPFPKRSTA